PTALTGGGGPSVPLTGTTTPGRRSATPAPISRQHRLGAHAINVPARWVDDLLRLPTGPREQADGPHPDHQHGDASHQHFGGRGAQPRALLEVHKRRVVPRHRLGQRGDPFLERAVILLALNTAAHAAKRITVGGQPLRSGRQPPWQNPRSLWTAPACGCSALYADHGDADRARTRVNRESFGNLEELDVDLGQGRRLRLSRSTADGVLRRGVLRSLRRLVGFISLIRLLGLLRLLRLQGPFHQLRRELS